MLLIKENKIVGIFNDDVEIEIKEEGGVIKEDNQFYTKYEHTEVQKKLIREMKITQLEGKIIELGGMNVKYVKYVKEKCEECPFSVSKSDNWDITLEACIRKCKPEYRFEIVN